MLLKKVLYRGFIVGGVLAAMLFISCSIDDNPFVDPVAGEIDATNWAQIEGEAFAAFADARAEFFRCIPSAYTKKRLSVKEIMDTLTPPADADSIAWDSFVIDSSVIVYGEISPDEFDVQERIVALAFEAQMTGDDTELIVYLRENGLYNKFQDVTNKYNIQQHAKNLSMRPKNASIKRERLLSREFIDGDIFLKYDRSSSASMNNSSVGSNILGWLIPGKWGHAAFLDAARRELNTQHFLLSASDQTDRPNNNALGRVGYDKIDSYWTNATEIAVSRVRNANNVQRRAAISHATQFIDRPWSVNTSREANDKFYCSKIVYRGWLSQGYELEPRKDSFTGLPWIQVPEFWRWNYTKVLGVKIYYPEFRMVWLKDVWITPTDLKETSLTSDIANF